MATNEQKLKIFLEWKKEYTESLIDSLNPSGDVLEVGFGLGYAANRIHSHHPKSHTIIEADPVLYEEAKKWANKKAGVTVIHGKWETLLPKLGKFDAVFFNDYPVEYDLSTMNFLFPEAAIQTADQAKKLLETIEKQLSQLTVKFTDQQIDEFYNEVGQKHSNELPAFFKKLLDNGNITQKQYENSLKKFHLAKVKDGAPPDRLVLFLKDCLKGHLNKGGRFTCYLNSRTSKYEDSHFFEHIITNVHVEYKESMVPLKISDQVREALVIQVQHA